MTSMSIVIPTYNRAEFLKKAVDTALAQTSKCEVVVVDHGSSDKTPDVAKSYGERILYIRREQDDGPCIAWLDGILRSGSKYVHLTYDDDWIADDFVAKTLHLMNDDVAVVFTNADVVRSTDSFLALTSMGIDTGYGPSEKLTRCLMSRKFAISPGCAVFHRADALEALMMTPPQLSNSYHGAGPDLMMFLRALAKRPSFYFLDQSLAFFRSHEQSITTAAFETPDHERQLARAYAEYKIHFLTSGIVPMILDKTLESAPLKLWENKARVRKLLSIFKRR